MNKYNIIEVRISDIRIGDRFRKDMGDLQALAQSVKDGELLQPIGITPDNELVFGERRLRAYRDILGRETIPARIVDVRSVLLGQIEENSLRKDFTITERIAIVEALRCFKHGGDRRSDQVRKEDDETLTLDDACARAGFSKDSFYRAKHVEEKGVPELVAAMDAGKLSIHAAETLAQASPDEQEQCLTQRLNEGRATARAVQKALSRLRSRKRRDEALGRVIEVPTANDPIGLFHCPFQHLEKVARLEPDSVALICTDPPYHKEFIPHCEELAQFAARVLKPGGLFVSYFGHCWLLSFLKALGRHLQWVWMNASVYTTEANIHHPVSGGRIASTWKPVVVFSKGIPGRRLAFNDAIRSTGSEKEWHDWQQPLPEVEKMVHYFSDPGDLVVDPCAGGFTTAIACHRTNRRFIGCDIDHAAVVKGQERLAQERQPVTMLPLVRADPLALNSIVQGDCRDVAPRLPDKSIALGIMSPPYAQQRKGQYPGVPEAEYPAFTVDWMSKLCPKLTDDGSVLIVIDPHVENGVLADYVLRTQLALREAGWKQHMPLMWLKEDRCPIGHTGWLRHAYEQVLWFSKTPKPFCDPKAGGDETEVEAPRYRYSQWSPGGKSAQGVKRASDVIDIPVGLTPKGVDHPAMFPIELAEHLIRHFCRPGGTVWDGFAGSGNSLLAAARLGHSFYGCDIKAEYVELAQRRLAEAGMMPKAG